MQENIHCQLVNILALKLSSENFMKGMCINKFI